MADTRNNEAAQPERDAAMQSSSPRVADAGAWILQIAVPALLAAATVHVLSLWGILLTGTFWLAFSIYWGVAP